jgi:purine-binding chemotaxis protein CheW
VLSLGFPVGPDWYAVDFDWVREVVAHPTVTPIPTAPAVVLGLFNLRGDMVPVFDTGRILGVGAVAAPAYVVVVDSAAGPAGLVAGGLPVTVRLGDALGPGESPVATGIHATEDGTVVTRLDVGLLVAPGRLLGTGVE